MRTYESIILTILLNFYHICIFFKYSTSLLSYYKSDYRYQSAKISKLLIDLNQTHLICL